MNRIVVFVVVAAVLLAGCSGASKPGPVASPDSPASSPPATPRAPVPEDPSTPEADGADGFRTFARVLDLALARGDIEFLTARLKGTPYTCKPEDIPMGLGGPACDRVGQQFDAFLIGHWRSEGGTYPVETAARLLRRLKEEGLPVAKDSFGEGRPRVYGLGIRAGRYATVLTALVARPANFAGSGPLRVVEVVSWRFDSGRWQATSLLSAWVLAEEFLTPVPEIDQYVPGWEKFAP